jgi:mannitol/fructose-specific phosphotransferase system IIA component (Ntr-type)
MQFLAAIGSILRDKELVSNLVRAPSPDEAVKILSSSVK